EFIDAINEANAASRQLAIAQNAQELTEDLDEARESRRLLIKIRNDENAPIHARIRCAALLAARRDPALRRKGASPMSKGVDKPRQNTTTDDKPAASEAPPFTPFPPREGGRGVRCEKEKRPKFKLRIPRQNLSEHDRRMADELDKADRENARQT